eukprot:1144543-Pelagomonas_calceolata.AAC.1
MGDGISLGPDGCPDGCPDPHDELKYKAYCEHAEETLPSSIKEKETHWLRRAVSLLHHKAAKKKRLIGIWKVTGSTRLQNLAVRSITVCHSTSSGNKLVCILNRMGMKSFSKFIGSLMVQSKLCKLIQGMISIAGPTDIQKYSVDSRNIRTYEFAEVCMLPLCRLQLLFRPCVFTLLDFNQVHVPLIYMELVGLSHAVGCCGPLCRIVSALYRIVDLEVVMRQPIITPSVHVNQACPPSAFAKSFDDHSSSNIVALSFMLEMMWFWQPESMWSA